MVNPDDLAVDFWILYRPDSRVVGLIKRMGASLHPKQKRILCMNKVDLVENKKDLLTVAEQFKDLPGYERYYWFLLQKVD